jgi:4-carboxymuconolactone decarboxylase
MMSKPTLSKVTVSKAKRKTSSSKPARDIIWGEKSQQIEANLKDLDADLAALIVHVAYDDVFERPSLNLKTKELLAIAHLLSLGLENELKTHIYGAFNCGATELEIRETILHAAMFIGFPKAVLGMKVLKSVLQK